VSDDIVEKPSRTSKVTFGPPTPPPSPPEADQPMGIEVPIRTVPSQKLLEDDEVVHLQATLLNGCDFLATHRDGMPDLFVHLSLCGISHRSRVVPGTLNPEWGATGQSFRWSRAKSELFAASIELTVFDKEHAGSYEMACGSLPLSHLIENTRALEPGSSSTAPAQEVDGIESQAGKDTLSSSGSSQMCEVQLSPAGKLRLLLTWKNVFSSSEAERKSARIYEASFAKEKRSTRVAVHVNLVSATGLRAADQNGTSDPYAILRLGSTRRRSRTVPTSLNPVWDEDFEFTCLQGQVESSSIGIDIWDKDIFSRDDFLGHAELPLSLLVGGESSRRSVGTSFQDFELRLSLQGSVLVRVRMVEQGRIDEIGKDQYQTVDELIAKGQREGVAFSSLPLKRLKQTFTLVKLSFTVVAAESLKAADRNGASDPYAVVRIGKRFTRRSRTVARTLSPVWDESLHFEVELQELLDAPCRIEVLNEDSFSKDALIGSATVDLTPIARLILGRSLSEPQLIRLKLEDEGELFLKVTLRDLQAPSVQKLMLHISRRLLPAFMVKQLSEIPTTALRLFRECVVPLVRVQNWPTALRNAREAASKVTITVTILSARDLLASDLNGLSDPYAKITAGPRTYHTHVAKRDLNPTWNESFTFTLRMSDLWEAPITVEVFDADVLSADESLGVCEYDIRPLIESAGINNTPATTYSLQLSTQGSVLLKLSVDSIVRRPWVNVVADVLTPPIIAFRAFFLYNRMPYDRTFFSKMRDPWTLVLMYIAASPTVWLRGSFFTFYLICIAFEREEFQLMKFILSLKGTQFLSGIIKLAVLCLSFWHCTVAIPDANGCREAGPGVGKPPLNDLMMLLWLQVLLWIAFHLLPYSGTFDEQTGTVSFRRASLLWARAKQESTIKTSPESFAGIENTTFAWFSNRSFLANRRSSQIFPHPPTSKAAKEKEPTPKKRSIWPPRWRNRDKGYTKLTDLEDPSRGKLGNLKHHESQLPRPPQPDLVQSTASSSVGNYATAWATFKSDLLAATFPIRTGATKNRLFMLLTWDTRAFKACALLYLVLMSIAIDAEEVQRELLEGELSHVRRLGNTVYTLTTKLLSLQLFSMWQSHITVEIVKLVFALTSVPFFFFMIDQFSMLFTHTDPTGYTPDGRIVATDTVGLSAYIRWIKEDILSEYSLLREELENHCKFNEKDVQKLYTAVEEGELMLKTVARKPGSLRATTRKMREIDAILSKLVTRDRVSDEVYALCFPDKILVENYKRKMDEQTNEQLERAN